MNEPLIDINVAVKERNVILVYGVQMSRELSDEILDCPICKFYLRTTLNINLIDNIRLCKRHHGLVREQLIGHEVLELFDREFAHER